MKQVTVISVINATKTVKENAAEHDKHVNKTIDGLENDRQMIVAIHPTKALTELVEEDLEDYFTTTVVYHQILR